MRASAGTAKKLTDNQVNAWWRAYACAEWAWPVGEPEFESSLAELRKDLAEHVAGILRIQQALDNFDPKLGQGALNLQEWVDDLTTGLFSVGSVSQLGDAIRWGLAGAKVSELATLARTAVTRGSSVNLADCEIQAAVDRALVAGGVA